MYKGLKQKLECFTTSTTTFLFVTFELAKIALDGVVHFKQIHRRLYIASDYRGSRYYKNLRDCTSCIFISFSS